MYIFLIMNKVFNLRIKIRYGFQFTSFENKIVVPNLGNDFSVIKLFYNTEKKIYQCKKQMQKLVK